MKHTLLNITVSISIVSLPLFTIGCGEGTYSTTVFPMAKITGTAPSSQIEAFCEDGIYTKSNIQKSDAMEYPFEISVPKDTNCRLIVVNENTDTNKVVSQIQFQTEAISGPTFSLQEDLNVGSIHLPVNPNIESINSITIPVASNQITINNDPISTFDENHNGNIDAYEDMNSNGVLDAFEPDYVPPSETIYTDDNKGSSDDIIESQTSDTDDNKGSSDDIIESQTSDTDDNKGSSDDIIESQTSDTDDDKGSSDDIDDLKGSLD